MTGVQLVKPHYAWQGEGSSYDTHLSKYTYNKWKELAGGYQLGEEKFLDRKFKVIKAFKVMEENPREGVRMLSVMYALFKGLPKPLQEEFLGIVGSYPCDVDGAIDRDMNTLEVRQIYPAVKNVTSRMVGATSKEHQRDMRYVLRLIADHNICVGKGEIIKRQIDDLVGSDVTTIPDHWSEGHLDVRVVAKKMAELNKLLQNKRK